MVLKDHARLLQEWALNRGGGDRWGGQKPIRYSRWNASTFRILTRWLHGKDSDALPPSQTSGKEYIEAYEFAWSYKARGLQDYVLAELSRRLLPEGYTESISYINTIWGAELKGSALERFLIDGIILEAERPWLGEVGNEDGDLDPTLTTSDEAVQPLPLNPYLFYALMRQYRTIGVIEQAAKHTFKMIDEQACRYHSHGANEKCPYGAAAPAPAENPQTPVSTATTPDQVTITAPAANSYTSMDGLRLRDLSNEAISAQLQRIDEESNRLNQERTRMYAEMYRRLAPAAEPRTMVQKRKAHAQAQGRSVQLMVEISLPQETGQLRAAEEDQ